MAKNKLAMLLQKEYEKGFADGIRCGIQYNNDLYHMALNDPDIVGKDVFGGGRLEKIHHAVEDMSDYYHLVLNADHVECDVYREKMDKKLSKIFKDKFLPFELRYPELKDVSYGGKKT